MLGLFRYLLAMMVVLSHLWPWTAWWQGTYAVFGFYVISGYLMTLIVNVTYAKSGTGFLGFWLNRVLRIYPPYYFALLVSFLVIFLLPVDFVARWNPKLRMPEGWYEWFSNLAIWGLGHYPVGQTFDIPFIGGFSIRPISASLVPPA